MKILILSDINSVHTQKWVRGLSDHGFTIGLFSFSYSEVDWFRSLINVELLFQPASSRGSQSFLDKLGYLKYSGKLKLAIRRFCPDVLHAHYASSYGLLGSISGFHPYIISVWGSDVYDFPKTSFLHKKIFQYNLSCADQILSTSEIMRRETGRYTKSDIQVTPFGVDTDFFSPAVSDYSLFEPSDIVVGQIKSFEPKYGTDILISAFHRARERHPELPLKLLLVGKGSLLDQLREMVDRLGISNHVVFSGRIPHEEIVRYHNMIDIFVSASVDDSESFGVSAVEACSCAKAVVVARTGGLVEVVVENQTGLVAERGDVESTANSILHFALNPQMRKEFGIRAREHVKMHYDWKNNLKRMINIYRKFKSVGS